MKKNKKNENFLNYIPFKNEKIQWEKTENGLVQIIVNRDGFIDKIVRMFFNTPNKMKLDLDELGSFVWESIDNEKNIYDISLLVRDRFGDKAEPIYDRLVTYINILRNNKFIEIKRRSEDD